MHQFSYLAAQNTSEAIRDANSNSGSSYIAGGTTLIDLMKLNVVTPNQLIDISGLGLDKIETLADGSLRIGAMVRNSDMAESIQIKQRYPMLSQALLSGASVQLRNMATLAGNILQRTRCPYFRDTTLPCNKRAPGSGCGSLSGGCSRSNAVLGVSKHCIASHPSDMCVALVALDATIHVSGSKGDRSIAFHEFHLAPGDHPDIENPLRPGDLITSVDLKPMDFIRNSTYIKVRDRASFAFALVSAAVALETKASVVLNARIALGGVATKPWRAHEAEHYLIGKSPTAENFGRCAELALRGSLPTRQNEFKVELAKRTIVRALSELKEA